MMSLRNATVYVFALAGVALAGIIVLIATNKVVPTELWALTTALVSGGLGLSVPTPPTTTTPLPVSLVTPSGLSTTTVSSTGPQAVPGIQAAPGKVTP